MKVFVIGSGGKIHSLVWKLAQSPRVSEIFCTFNNAEMKKLAQVVEIRENNDKELHEFIKENQIDQIIVESLTTSTTGLPDKLREEGYNVFGPGENSSKISLARGFAKKFIYKHKIPTPQFGIFDKEAHAITHARQAVYPQIVKFDSRVPGTGTIICETFNEAKNAISFCLKNMYKPIVMENFITGKEVSFQVICDGYNAVPLNPVYVYKKLNDGDSGLTTDGMGGYSPVSYINERMEAKIAEKIFFPLIDGLNAEKMGFAGVLRANIIIDKNDNPYLVGINVDFGDPETQMVMPVLNEDILDIILLTSMGALGDTYEVFRSAEEHAVCVSMVSDGYPGEYKKGQVIEGLEEIDDDNTYVFHAGTNKNIYGETVTSGGKVLDIVSTASTLGRARELAYESVDLIEFNGMKYRKDIARSKTLSKIDL